MPVLAVVAMFALASMVGRLGASLSDGVANGVLGQADFVNASANRAGAPRSDTLDTPQSLTVDTSVTPNRLYVTDSFNNRVLVWLDATGFSDGEPADVVIGQPDLVRQVSPAQVFGMM